MHVYSSSESRLVASRKVCGRVLSLAWGRDNSLYVGSEAGTVARLRVAAAEAEAEVLALPSLHTAVHCLAVRGSTLAAASRTIVVWDLATEAVIKTLTGHSSPVTSLHFDPAGSVLLSRYKNLYYIQFWFSNRLSYPQLRPRESCQRVESGEEEEDPRRRQPGGE